MQIHVQATLKILQHEPENLEHEISSHKQEASILDMTLIVQMILITSENSPEDFCFKITDMSLNK